MAWKHIIRDDRRRGSVSWLTRPQVSVCKRNISFNRRAMEAFGLKLDRMMDVFVDTERGLIGIKSADCGSPSAYRLCSNRSKSKLSMSINCAEIARHFPQAVGRTFDLTLCPGESVIVANVATPTET